MIAYVPRGALRVGDDVVLELHSIWTPQRRGELLAVIQASKITRVEASTQHSGKMDEVEF